MEAQKKEINREKKKKTWVQPTGNSVLVTLAA